MSEPKLFGTDGIRGIAGERLSAELTLAIGRAATATLAARRPQVLVIRDTRESGPMLEASVAAGIAQAGGDAVVAGVLPTPAASVLVRRLGLDLAIVISASHNPWRDNGIKFFRADGGKPGDELEAQIEAAVEDPRRGGAVGSVRGLEGSLDDYLRELERTFRLDLSGNRVVLDCAHGATYRAAPGIFRRLGAEVVQIGSEPDGRNINANCGSTHPERLAAEVVARAAEIGFAFDGDGDRVIAVDRRGGIRDGDELIALAARHLRDAGELSGGVAVTVMTNYGFHSAMSAAGIEVATTPVGDRHVAAELERRSWELGGEQSGHLIWRRFAPTGDGIAAALLTLRALAGGELADAAPIERLPQALVNVRVADRGRLDGAASVWEAVAGEERALAGRGRVLVRASGTEPLVRVMVEAPDREECDAVSRRLVEVVARELG